MPSIDQLPAAIVAADSDLLPASQGGTLRQVSRAQLLAGLQTQLAVPSATLLGRVDSGIGAPEPIAIGPGLLLNGGALAATPSMAPHSALAAGVTPNAPDLVAIGQSGHDAAVPYAQFMAGLTGLPYVDGGNLTVLPEGAATARRLSDFALDAVPVESFGAAGDGRTDDTAAFAAAIASGRPVRLGPKTYVIAGQFTIATANVVLIGTPGLSVLLRQAQSSGGAWISVQASGFRASGVTFDAGGTHVTQDSWGVLVTAACISASFESCVFRNVAGATLGCGLTFLASDPAVAEHSVYDCEFAGNSVHGLWVQACAGVSVAGCRAHDNGQYGICIDYNDPTFRQKARLIQVRGCRAWNNLRGIAVGNFNETNAAVPTWGNANPDAVSVLVADNLVHDNSLYGVAVSGRGLLICGNLATDNGSAGNSGAGILANVSFSAIRGNMVTGGALFGLDCGGSIHSDVSGNFVDGAVNGINCGGSLGMRVSGNTVTNCTAWAVLVANVESDAQGRNFGIACDTLEMSGNSLMLTAGASGGIALRDGPSNVSITNNSFVGADGALVSSCLCAATDSVVIAGNRWNGAPRFVCNPIARDGGQQIVFPDIADRVMITSAPGAVQSMISSYQAAIEGQIGFVRVTAGGQGYTQATVTIGGAGSGATAVAIISGGAVIGVQLTAPGSGYGAVGASVLVTITGDGTGAAATAYASVPLPDERQIRVRCNQAVTFARAGSAPAQENWTLGDLTVPAFGDVDWVVAWGIWRAVRATH